MKRTWVNGRAADFVVNNLCVNGKLFKKNIIFSYFILEITLKSMLSFIKYIY